MSNGGAGSATGGLAVSDASGIAGFKKDEGKPRYELIYSGFTRGLALKMAWAIKHKYPANNWKKVKHGRQRYYGALMRHVEAFRDGEWLDPETNLPHLAAAAFCVMCLYYYHEQNVEEAPFPCEDKKCDYCFPQNKELPGEDRTRPTA